MDDRGVLDAQPLPLARGFRRWLNAREARERHDAGYYLFEILYFVSDRDGSWCVYAQRLDTMTKRPVEGGLVEVQHLHGGRLSLRNVHLPYLNIAVSPGRLVLNLGERTGNVWLAELEED